MTAARLAPDAPTYTRAAERPLRAIGEPLDMIVGGEYVGTVGYIVSEVRGKSGWERFPFGTVFFVGEELPPGLGSAYYAVTCKHLILDARDNPEYRGLYIRVNDRDGKAQDVPSRVDDWILSPDSDVAVSQLTLGPSHAFWPYPILSRSYYPRLGIGQNVFSVGLFFASPGIDSVNALVRTGTVARLSVDVELTINEHRDEKIIANVHLLEAAAWGGESGSPVFAYKETYTIPGSGLEAALASVARYPKMDDLHVKPEVVPTLVGLLYGHFTIKADLRSSKRQKIKGVDINSGIAVMVPAGKILALLMDDRLVEDRKRMAEERRRKFIGKPRPS